MTMNSRNAILNQLRRQFVASAELPEISSGSWTRYSNPVEKFAEMVAFAGATCETVGSKAEVHRRLKGIAQFASAKQVLSLVDEIPGNLQLAHIEQPQELKDLDYVICQGHLAVAENGGIWLTDSAVRHRVCFFITQFLVLLVRAEDIVHNMHEAYQKIPQRMASFGLFLAGPSKTADIEQSLVIGAHGCRELQVFILQ